MQESEFYFKFCEVMRRRGEVKSKNLAELFEVSRTTARKHLKNLMSKGKIKKKGSGRSTAYVFN